MGLDTLENSSAAAAVAWVGGGEGGILQKHQCPYVLLKKLLFWRKMENGHLMEPHTLEVFQQICMQIHFGDHFSRFRGYESKEFDSFLIN